MKLMMSIPGQDNPLEVESPILPQKSDEIAISTAKVQGSFKVTNIRYKVAGYAVGEAELQVHVSLSNI